ncbi:hypothetical protein, partial [Paraburkholderia mimosarum]|uniref:hypothetical protein n=1 Tax=Paraburkholderia mimosarum TaxID=312026 RepID=UPI0005A82056
MAWQHRPDLKVGSERLAPARFRGSARRIAGSNTEAGQSRNRAAQACALAHLRTRSSLVRGLVHPPRIMSRFPARGSL